MGTNWNGHLIRSTVLLGLLSTVTMGTVAAQGSPEWSTEVGPVLPWYLEGVGAAVLTVVVAGLLVSLAPNYTRRVTDRALEEPGMTFLVGVLASIAFVVVVFALFLTVLLAILAIPLVLVAIPIAFVASALGYLTAARLVTDDFGAAVLIAGGVAFGCAIVPWLGGLANLVIVSVGTGALLVDYQSR